MRLLRAANRDSHDYLCFALSIGMCQVTASIHGSGLVMPPCQGVAASAAEMSVAGDVNEAGGWRKLVRG